MTMTPIAATINGEALTFALPFAQLNTILDQPALDSSGIGHSKAKDPPQIVMNALAGLSAAQIAGIVASSAANTYDRPTPTSQSMWAAAIEAAGSRTASRVDQGQIKAIIRESLIGAGMASVTAANKAGQLMFTQLDRQVDLLAAQIVRAAILAG